MKLVCPRCNSETKELIECDNCKSIGCHRCMKKSYGKWICFKCEKEYYEFQIEEKKPSEISDVMTSMFG